MVLLLAKNSKDGCLFRPNFLKQVVIEIQKMERPRQQFSKYPPRGGGEAEILGNSLSDHHISLSCLYFSSRCYPVSSNLEFKVLISLLIHDKQTEHPSIEFYSTQIFDDFL